MVDTKVILFTVIAIVAVFVFYQWYSQCDTVTPSESIAVTDLAQGEEDDSEIIVNSIAEDEQPTNYAPVIPEQTYTQEETVVESNNKGSCKMNVHRLGFTSKAGNNAQVKSECLNNPYVAFSKYNKVYGPTRFYDYCENIYSSPFFNPISFN